MDLHQIIADWGYLALFIWTFLEGETVLIVAGFFAHTGALNLYWVILTAFAGTFAGDQTFFYLGRHKGIAFLEKRPTWHAKADKVFDLLKRHETWVILGFRFVYGIRNVTPFVIGASQIGRLKFFLLNATGAMVWAISFGYFGYTFGDLAEAMVGHVVEYEKYILIILAVAGGLLFWRNTHIKKQQQKDDTP
jgi:membrane protein DedA with SNARE-associated domain